MLAQREMEQCDDLRLGLWIEIDQQIAARDQETWTLTSDLKHCRYCTYRTLCEQDTVEAPEPDWEPQEEPEDWEIDLDQVGEIAF